ncbi:MAG: helix-turn-helix domain-containing protein [Pseudonocardiaceae bacterium]
MNITRAIWQSAAVCLAIESGDRGAIMRSLREAEHLTLAQLATRCGYSISSLSRMERGKGPCRHRDRPLRSGPSRRRMRRPTRCVVAHCS